MRNTKREMRLTQWVFLIFLSVLFTLTMISGAISATETIKYITTEKIHCIPNWEAKNNFTDIAFSYKKTFFVESYGFTPLINTTEEFADLYQQVEEYIKTMEALNWSREISLLKSDKHSKFIQNRTDEVTAQDFWVYNFSVSADKNVDLDYFVNGNFMSSHGSSFVFSSPYTDSEYGLTRCLSPPKILSIGHQASVPINITVSFEGIRHIEVLKPVEKYYEEITTENSWEITYTPHTAILWVFTIVLILIFVSFILFWAFLGSLIAHLKIDLNES